MPTATSTFSTGAGAASNRRAANPSADPRSEQQPALMLRSLGGRATRAELLARSSPSRLRRAVADGTVVRLARGLYTVPDLPNEQVVAAKARGVLSHVSAARHWGLQLWTPPEAVHVTVPHGARPAAQDGVRLHHTTLSDGEVVDQVTSALRTVLDCAAALTLPDALAVADSAIALRFLTQKALLDAAVQLRGPRRPRRITVARLADGRAHNALESALRGVVLGAGASGFEPQHEIRLPGYSIHVDLGDPVRRIAIEAEGFGAHGRRSGFLTDCERYDELVRLGWLVLRFAWDHVMFRADWVAAVVTDVVARRS